MKEYLIKNRLTNWLNIGWIILNAILATATAVLLTFSTNAIFAHNIQKLLYWSGLNLLFWLVYLLSDYLRKFFQEKLVQKICSEIRDTLINGIAQQDYSQFHQRTVEQYISQYTNDIGMIETNYLNNYYSLIANVFAVISSVIALAFYHYLLAGTAVLFAVLLMIIPGKISRPLKEATTKLSTANEELVNGSSNLFKGFDTLYSYNRSAVLPHLFVKEAQQFAKSKVNYRRVAARVENTIGAISIFCQLGVLILTGVLATLKMITGGAISSTGNLAATFFNSLSQISNQYTTIQATKPLLEKFNFEQLNQLEEKQAHKLSGQPDRCAHQIVVENLNYSVAGKSIFKNLNLKFLPGEKILVVGGSGIGKSTLLKIISGQITNYTGRVLIDGQELHGISKDSLNNLVTYIDQKPYLFSTTIENNVSLWEPQVTTEQVNGALNKVNADFVTDLTDRIVNNGENLSLGQQQRIALSRYYIRNTPIALLDEGTSALDNKNAQLVEKNLLLDKQRTVIEVAHRFNAENAAFFSQVVDLENLT